MAENGQTLVPTLSTFHDVSEDHAEKYPCVLVGQAERQREEAYETLAAAKAAGVRIAMGFDSYPLGQNARELVRMVEGGLTPMEGIVAATSGAADALGLGDVGRVDRGSVADLLVLDGDPLSDPAVLLDAERIRLVVQGGEIISAAPRPGQGARTE
jgi:imidazolonepropionase-like amidohydrolase